MQMISREEAIAQGISWYFTGVPCARGHVARRTVIRNECWECRKLSHKKYDEANAVDVNARSQKWYVENTEKAKKTRANWRQENTEKDRAAIALYQAAHKEHLQLASKDWVARNRPHLNSKHAQRQARKIKATPTWANQFYMAEAYSLAKLREKICEGKWHVDHIVPLRSKIVCGLHCEANFQVIPSSVNLSKSNRHWPDMPA